MSALTPPPAGTVTMFSTTWCSYCRRLKTLLDRQGVGYTEVNIEEDPQFFFRTDPWLPTPHSMTSWPNWPSSREP
jgi:Glutaredoxin